MAEPIREIVVMGGGTAGWLSAAYLNRALSPQTKITLIESSDIPTVGVGEATIPTLRGTMDFLGLREDEWMPKCSATFKNAIRFNGWLEDGKPEHGFYHPFGDRPDRYVSPWPAPHFPAMDTGFPLYHYWLSRKLAGQTDAPMTYECHPTAALCDAGKAPRMPESDEHLIRAAYHVDAGLLAKLLRDTAKARGVHHVVDRVADVVLDERGWVRHLVTDGGLELPGQLFLDCSGFRGRIINQALGQKFIDDRPSLKVNAAVAIQSKSDPERDGVRPYTLSTAIEHGWVWDVPLMHRNGCGYVYADDCIDGDQAEAELRAFLGPRCEGMPARHLKMRIGRNPEPWVANCVAIGLSSCFLEPLESTGIFLTEFQLGSLLPVFPSSAMEEPLRRRYNTMVRDVYLELRDFIVLHYVTSRRKTSKFWQMVRNETEVPDTLKEKLELFDVSLPMLDAWKFTVFKGQSYACILDGMDHLPSNAYPILEQTGAGAAAAAKVAERTAELLQRLPDHYTCLRTMAGD